MSRNIHLLDIEKGENHRSDVSIPLTVVGVGEVYLLPEQVFIICDRKKKAEKNSTVGNCRNCRLGRNKKVVSIPLDSEIWIDCVRCAKEMVEKKIIKAIYPDVRDQYKCNCIAILLNWEKSQTVSELIVYPYAQEVRMEKGNIVDEVGKEFRKKRVFYLGQKDSSVQSYQAEGWVMPNPKSQEATFLIKNWKSLEIVPEGCRQIEIPLDELGERVASLSEITGIYQQADAHLGVLMNYASPLRFYFQRRLYEGWGKIAFLGDTTTGKGTIANGIRRELGMGGVAIGESASRAGLLYGVETIGSTHVLQWGLIPRYDGQHLMIDGCNAILPSEWRACREAIRQGIVRVDKITGGRHPARTRLLFIGNPKRSLTTYSTRIEALKDLFESPDIARLDIVFTFGVDDVPPEVVNQASNKLRSNANIKPFKANIAFAWNCQPKQIKFTKGAVHLILEKAKSLIEAFLAHDIPLVPNDMKIKLARLSIEIALLCGRKKVTTKEVEFVNHFIRRIYIKAGLDKYSEATKIEHQKNSQVRKAEIISWFEAALKTDAVFSRIVNEILRKGLVLSIINIASKLKRDRKTVGKRINLMRAKGLVHQTKDGIAPTREFWNINNDNDT